jgi:two-component system, NarL family, invasion response regulator UvrY
MADSITVLLVDDHAVVRSGCRLLLSCSEGIGEVLEAESGESAYSQYLASRPDIVVMDLSLPGASGLAAIRRIVSRDPEAKILVFSMHDEPVYVTRALEAGAKGYITKSAEPDMLVEAVYRVVRGERFIEPQIARRLDLGGNDPSGLAELSAREFEVFSLLAKGYTTHEAAQTLCLSIKTIANYNTAIKGKLNVRTNADLIRLAYHHGILTQETETRNRKLGMGDEDG